MAGVFVGYMSVVFWEGSFVDLNCAEICVWYGENGREGKIACAVTQEAQNNFRSS
jgi:hypothetical protein